MIFGHGPRMAVRSFAFGKSTLLFVTSLLKTMAVSLGTLGTNPGTPRAGLPLIIPTTLSGSVSNLVTNVLNQSNPASVFWPPDYSMLVGCGCPGGCIGTTSRHSNRTSAIWGEALAQAVARLPQNIYESQAHPVAEPTFDQTVPAPDYVKPNAYCLHDGMVCIREENVLRPLTDLPGETRSRMRATYKEIQLINQFLT